MPSATFTDSRYRLDYTVTQVGQDIANNRSLVRTALTIVKTGVASGWSNNASYYGVGSPSGQNGSFTYNFGGSSSLGLVYRDDWVGHNADGTMSFSTSAWVSADTPLGSASIGSFTVWLTTIPRATTPNVTGGSFTTGVESTINLPRASGSFTHDVTYSIGTKSGTIGTGIATSVQFTPPDDLMTEAANSPTGTIRLHTVTKNGSTTIGTKDTDFVLNPGATVIPKVNNVLWDDNNTTVKANIGAFVQGQSQVKGSVQAEGIYGSTIVPSSLRVNVNGSYIAENTQFTVGSAGTYTAFGEAADTRGKVVTKTANFTVLPYEPPTIGANGWSVKRANASNVPTDTGQYLRLDLHVIAKSLKPSTTEKNFLKISIRTRPLDGAWSAPQIINPGLVQNGAIQISGGANFLVSKSYLVEVSITDNTGISPLILNTTVPTATVTLDMNGTNVGIGKYHEQGALDVAGDVYSNGKKLINYDEAPDLPTGMIMAWTSNGIPNNFLLCNGQAVSRTTYSDLFAVIGTTYGAGNGSSTFNVPDFRGRVPAGRDSTKTAFNTLGKVGGTERETLTIEEMPSHNHPLTSDGLGHSFSWGRTFAGNVYSTGVAAAGNTPGNNLATSQNNWHVTANRGGGGSHNNLQPYATVNFIIKASGGLGQLSNTVETVLTQQLADTNAAVKELSSVTLYDFGTTPATVTGGGWTVFTNSNLWVARGETLATPAWNNGISIAKSGIYQVDATVLCPGTTAVLHLVVKKNSNVGSMLGAVMGNVANTTTTTSEVSTSGMIHCNAGDYLCLAVYSPTPGSKSILAEGTHFGARLVRAD